MSINILLRLTYIDRTTIWQISQLLVQQRSTERAVIKKLILNINCKFP